jgi:transglutaminase-like putative cysteine protease
MLLELTHDTVFEYSAPVCETYMEFRLTPVTDGSQHLLQHRQRVSPSRPVRQYVDALGNTVSYFNLLSEEERIEVSFDSVVETFPTAFRGVAANSDGYAASGNVPLLYNYLRPTGLTAWCPEFLDFVGRLKEYQGAPPQAAATAIAETIHRSFRYEGEVTDASSPITDILTKGAGVCQDFAHLMLASCRYLGHAARYVSGYVLPKEMEGAVASHAWCEVFDPGQGWFGIDPTHDERTGEMYIRLGIGRDYMDVAPNRGVFRGKATEKMKVNVRLQPISPEELLDRARALYPQTRPGGHSGRTPRKPPITSIMLQTQTSQQQQQ